MALRRVVLFFAVLLAASVVAGCSEEKDDAIEAALEVRTLCKAKKNDEANTIGLELYEKNAVFREGVDQSAVTWRVKEIANYNYCGPGFREARRLMADYTEQDEGCGCHVVGQRSRPGVAGKMGAFAFLLGLLLLRRRRHPTDPD